MKCESQISMIPTPLIQIECKNIPQINLHAKLEGYNPTGSLKDRGANYILNKLLADGEINYETTIIESSSGNFGIALASVCRKLGLAFICVIDPNISSANEMLIHSLGAKIIKVEERDKHGGFLLNRITKVKSLQCEIKNSYWVNQYGNPLVAEAYAETLGAEIISQAPQIDFLFVGVSSGGTISGIHRKFRELELSTTVIPVDTAGSVIFGGPAKKRHIPGIGSTMVPDHFKYLTLEKAVVVEEADAVKACRELFERHCLFVGGSSGSVFHAVKQYFNQHEFSYKPNVIAVFADRGDRYADTIYCNDWCISHFEGANLFECRLAV